MKEPFISVLISEEKLNERIAQLGEQISKDYEGCLLYTSPSPRDPKTYRMPSSA